MVSNVAIMGRVNFTSEQASQSTPIVLSTSLPIKHLADIIM